MNRRGFSMLELIVAIAIIGIVAAAAIPSIYALRRDTLVGRAETEMRDLRNACLSYYRANVAFPADITALRSAGYLPADFPLTNPWGGVYEVQITSDTYCEVELCLTNPRGVTQVSDDHDILAQLKDRLPLSRTLPAMAHYVRSGVPAPGIDADWSALAGRLDACAESIAAGPGTNELDLFVKAETVFPVGTDTWPTGYDGDRRYDDYYPTACNYYAIPFASLANSRFNFNSQGRVAMIDLINQYYVAQGMGAPLSRNYKLYGIRLSEVGSGDNYVALDISCGLIGYSRLSWSQAWSYSPVQLWDAMYDPLATDARIDAGGNDTYLAGWWGE